MPLIPLPIIKQYAECLGILNLNEQALQGLAQDVEYRVRELIQDAMKYMVHARRQKLTIDDVNMALQARNQEPLHGYDPTEPLNYRLVPNTSIFYVPSEEIDLETYLQEPLPKAPAPMSLTSHWLAVEGVQPAIPENPVKPDRSFLGEPAGGTTAVAPGAGPLTAGLKGSTDDVELKGPVKHVLSRELQLLYDNIIFDLMESGDINKIEAALLTLESDAGLQNLLPYLVQFVADAVPRHLRDLNRLLVLMKMVRAVLVNPHLFAEPYLHQVLPPAFTCLLGKRLCEDPESEPHWSLRLDAADIIAFICRTWGTAYHTIVPRVTKTLAKTLADGEKPLTSHYGAIVGLTALGAPAIRSILVPVLRTYMEALGAVPDSSEKQQVLQALQDAAAVWLQSSPEEADQVQALFPSLMTN